jgi:hypothetical protein
MNFSIEPQEIAIVSKHSSAKDHEVIKDKEFFNSYENLIIIFSDSFTARYEGIMSEKQSSWANVEIFAREGPDQTINLNSHFSMGNEDGNNLFNKILEVEGEDESGSKNKTIKKQEDIFVPVLTKQGYVTNPPYEDLVRMTKRELEQVLNFSINTENGRIIFPGSTDLTYVDLDEAINIDYKSISVYQQVELPPEGEKLNRPAEITFFNYFISDEIKESDIQYSMFVNYINDQCRKLKVISILNQGCFKAIGIERRNSHNCCKKLQPTIRTPIVIINIIINLNINAKSIRSNWSRR